MLKNSLLKFLLNCLFALIGSIGGFVVGAELYYLLPFWTVIPIGQTSVNAVDILFVNYLYFDASRPEYSTLYIQTQSGDTYSLKQEKWQILPPLPDGKIISEIRLRDWTTDAPLVALAGEKETYELIDDRWNSIQKRIYEFKGFTPIACAAEWYIPAIGVTDSAGAVFSHALADEYVCYILFNDGRLQAWTRTLDAFSLMGVSILSALVGLIAGFKTTAITQRLQSWRAPKEVLINQVLLSRDVGPTRGPHQASIH